MIYYQYYLEIKNRVILSFLTWISCFIVCYYYKETLLFTFVYLSQFVKFVGVNFYFIFTDVTEIFSVYIQLVFFVANQILFVTILYHFILFLIPGLYKFEYTKLTFFLKVFLASWSISMVFFNYLFLPLSWEFFLNFQSQTKLKTFDLFFESKISEYMYFYINLYYICVLNSLFITIIISFILTFDHSFKTVQNFRRFFYFLFLVFSTIITPPDIISQLFLCVVLIFLYELLTFFKFLIEINKATN